MRGLHRLHRSIMVFSAATVVAVAPGQASAQVACTAGPLSAYLSTAGLGCSLGGTLLTQFAGAGLAAAASAGAAADEIFLDPFTLQGPPGFTWVGFNVRFPAGTVYAGDRPQGFSFWTNGQPVYGVDARQQLGSDAKGFSALRTRVSGDGGAIRAIDRYRDVNGALVADHRTCGLMGFQALSCIANFSTWHGAQLPDADGSYQVNVSSVLGATGTPNNYSVAVLVQTSSATPEPATLLLVASGLGAAGAAVRRRKKA